MLVRSFLCNVNDTRALIGLFPLVMSHWGQIREPWDSQVFTLCLDTGLPRVLGSAVQNREILKIQTDTWIMINIFNPNTADG